MSRLRVLAIDDDKSVCEFLADLLTPEGCDVTAANDPLQAIDLLREGQHDFHIAILDLRMPQMTGIEVLQQIRKVDRGIAVIILTAFPSLESATDAINLDVSAYMQKPFSGEEMRDTIARVARKKGIVVRREDELHVTVGKRIRDLRKERAMTLKQIGRRTGLSASLLSQIERAESSASVSTLYKIASALEVRLVDLLDEF